MDDPSIDVDRYLERIGFEGNVRLDLATLTALQRAHLTAVPFENLDIVAGVPVSTALSWSVPKIVERRRGGWCFELNGAFGELLRALGFDMTWIGAAVLLDGPTTMIDHLAIEVQLDEAFLVDVGFGDSFVLPLALNRPGPQDGGNAEYEFLASPEGTTLAEIVDGVPAARYRFKRVAHELIDFEAASRSLRENPDKHWRTKPFATRLLDGGPDRVTLLRDRLTIRRDGETTERPVPEESWNSALAEWFGMSDIGG